MPIYPQALARGLGFLYNVGDNRETTRVAPTRRLSHTPILYLVSFIFYLKHVPEVIPWPGFLIPLPS